MIGMKLAARVLETTAFAMLVMTNYATIPLRNTPLQHFDVIIVLGTPCLADGTPSLEQRERVLEGVREYQANVAPKIIMTGGPAHNSFVEAHCMKVLAVARGVPETDVIEEDKAGDTIQNIYFSHEIMQAHGWQSAEVVSSPSHLPRTALILAHYSFAWRTHPARWPPEYHSDQEGKLYWGEARGCWRYMHNGFPHNRWLPGS